MGQSISLLEGLSQLDADAIEAQLPLYLLEGVREEPDLVIAAKQLAMGHDAKIPFNLPQHGASLFLWQRREGELAELARFEHGVGHGVMLAQPGDEKSFTVEDLGPNVQVSLRCTGFLRSRKEIGQRVKAEGITELLLQRLTDGLILLQAQGAGGVDQYAAGFEGVKSALQQATLHRGNLVDALETPVAQRVFIFSHRPLAGAGGVEQDGVEGFRQPLAKDLGIEMGHADVGHTAALDIGAQHFQPAAGKLVGDQHAAVLHQRRDLGSLGARGGGRVQQHAIPSGLLTGKERRHRQHGARFLNIEEAAQMLGRVAKADALITAGEPEAGFTPGHGIQLPAKRRHAGDKLGYRDLEGVDPDAAPQRLPATRHECLHGEMGWHELRNVTQEVIGEVGVVVHGAISLTQNKGRHLTTVRGPS